MGALSVVAAATLDSTAARSEAAAAVRGAVVEAVEEAPLAASNKAFTPLRAAALVGREGIAKVEEEVSCASAPAAPLIWAVVRVLEEACREAATEPANLCCRVDTEPAAACEEATAAAPVALER